MKKPNQINVHVEVKTVKNAYKVTKKGNRKPKQVQIPAGTYCTDAGISRTS